MNDEHLDALVRLSAKLGALDDIRQELSSTRGEVNTLREEVSKLITLTPEESQFIRSKMQASIAERDFWMDLRKKLAGAGVIAAVGLLATALWHYVKYLIRNGG